jgi:hypothetical protein
MGMPARDLARIAYSFWSEGELFDADLTNGGGLNGSFLLNSRSVHSNGLADKLYGGVGMDWYFAGLLDVLFNQKTGEIVTSI